MENQSKTSSSPPVSMAGGGAGGETWSMKIISGIKSALGLGQGKTYEAGAQTGDVSMNLARQRIVLRGNANRLLYEKGREKNHE